MFSARVTLFVALVGFFTVYPFGLRADPQAFRSGRQTARIVVPEDCGTRIPMEIQGRLDPRKVYTDLLGLNIPESVRKDSIFFEDLHSLVDFLFNLGSAAPQLHSGKATVDTYLDVISATSKMLLHSLDRFVQTRELVRPAFPETLTHVRELNLDPTVFTKSEIKYAQFLLRLKNMSEDLMSRNHRTKPEASRIQDLSQGLTDVLFFFNQNLSVIGSSQNPVSLNSQRVLVQLRTFIESQLEIWKP